LDALNGDLNLRILNLYANFMSGICHHGKWFFLLLYSIAHKTPEIACVMGVAIYLVKNLKKIKK